MLNPLLNWQPVESFKKRGYVVVLGGAKNETGGMVLNTLKLLNDVERGARKKGIAIIKPGKDKGTEQSFCGIFSKKMTDGGNAADFKETFLTDIFDMLMERQGLIKCDPKVVNSGRKCDRRTVQIDRRGKRRVVEMFFGCNQNHFCFIFIELQFVHVHPHLEIGNTGLGGGDEVGEVRDRSREIELIIIRETMVRERVVSGNRRNGLSVEDEQNGPQNRALGNAVVQRRSRGRKAVYRDRLVAIGEI